jgi:hypothetical protein
VLAVFARDSSIVGEYTGQATTRGGWACLVCVVDALIQLYRLVSATETPNTANSVLSTDSSAADIAN